MRGDAFKTLFVARLSYDTTEKDLEREFGRFGPIERVCTDGNCYVMITADSWFLDTHCHRHFRACGEWHQAEEKEKDS